MTLLFDIRHSEQVVHNKEMAIFVSRSCSERFSRRLVAVGLL